MSPRIVPWGKPFTSHTPFAGMRANDHDGDDHGGHQGSHH